MLSTSISVRSDTNPILEDLVIQSHQVLGLRNKMSIQTFDNNELSQIKSRLNHERICVIRNVFDNSLLGKLDHSIRLVVANKLLSLKSNCKDWGNKVLNSPIDALLSYLDELDPCASEVVLGLGLDMPEFYSIISNECFLLIMKYMLESDSIQIPLDHCLCRIDRPNSNKTSFDWHQDYPYNVLSEDSVTFWIPIRDIDINMGPLMYLAKSHKAGILPVKINRDAKTFNPNRLQIDTDKVNATTWDQKCEDIGSIDAGSLILFSCKLLHKSGTNLSNSSRLVVNGRCSKFNDNKLMERNWYSALKKYPFYFKRCHPDLVTDDIQDNYSI